MTLPARSPRPAVRLGPLLAALAVLLSVSGVVLGVDMGGHAVARDVDDVLQGAAALVAAAACGARARRSVGRRRRAWGWLALATGAWTAGQCVWTFEEAVLGREAPLPSPADLGFLLFPVAAAVALLLLQQGGVRIATRQRQFLDGLILAGSLLLVSWSTVLGPVWLAGRRPVLPFVVSVAYPIGDLLLVTAALVALTRTAGPARRTLLVLTTGLGALAVSDSAFAYLELSSHYTSGTPLGLGWQAGFALVAAAALTDRTADTPSGEVSVPGPLALAAPYGLVFVACCLEVWRCAQPDSRSPVEPLVMVGLLGLVLARQALVLVENRSLVVSLQRKEDLSRRQTRHLEGLLRAVRQLTEAPDDTSAALILGDVVRELLGADRVIVFLPDRERPEHYLARAVAGRSLARDHTPTPPDGAARVVPEAGRGPLYREPGRGGDLALETGRVVLASDIGAAGSISPELVSELGVTSVGWVPVPADEGYVGVFALSWRERRCALSPFEHSVLGVLAQHAGSVLAQLREVARLEAETRTDPLTGLANRGAVDAAVATLRPGDAVVLLDLDHFKDLNDTRGHDAGDAALVSFAAALRTACRRDDLAGRFGGEEFVLLLRQTDEAGAVDVVTRLRHAWAEAGAVVTFSAGVAEVPPAASPEHALHSADRALYAAKRAGRDRVRVAGVAEVMAATVSLP
jgi:diguanylate cyclase (GGDEF)-like protein